MAMLKDSDKDAIRLQFQQLSGEVKLVNFTQELECQYCRETNQIVKEIGELSDKISVQTYNFVTDKELAEKFGIDKIPATVVMGKEDHGIRFYGIPSGYEFTSLLESIKMVSAGESGLGKTSKEVVGRIKKPVHLQVFVTPM